MAVLVAVSAGLSAAALTTGFAGNEGEEEPSDDTPIANKTIADGAHSTGRRGSCRLKRNNRRRGSVRFPVWSAANPSPGLGLTVWVYCLDHGVHLTGSAAAAGD